MDGQGLRPVRRAEPSGGMADGNFDQTRMIRFGCIRAAPPACFDQGLFRAELGGRAGPQAVCAAEDAKHLSRRRRAKGIASIMNL